MQIYKTINNVDGKVYIGQNLHDNPNYLGSGTRLWNAIKKHGIENFTKEILEQVEVREQLNEREIFWIAYYRSIMPKGTVYNIADGGDGGDVISKHPDKYIIIEKRTKTFKENIAKLTDQERISKYANPGSKNGMYKDGHTLVEKFCQCGKKIKYHANTCNKCRDRSNFQRKQRKIEINGIKYDSQKDASQALKCSSATILYRLTNNKPGYKYIL